MRIEGLQSVDDKSERVRIMSARGALAEGKAVVPKTGIHISG
jgi:hypothetical protein